MPRTDTASRLIAAPPAQVYAALVDRDALSAWLPADGTTARFERFDPRPGGSYRLVLTYADASRAQGKMTRERRIRRTQEELEEGERRPCCWPGCKYRARTGV